MRQLHEAGFDLGDLSIVGRDFRETEDPCGFVSRGDYVKAGAESGSLFGGLFGLCIGAAFLVLPGIGPVVVAGPGGGAAGGHRRGAGGNRAGQPGGRASSGWEVPKDRAIHYRSRSREASFSSSSGPSPRLPPATEPARRPRAGAHRSLRAAGIVNPDRPLIARVPHSRSVTDAIRKSASRITP